MSVVGLATAALGPQAGAADRLVPAAQAAALVEDDGADCRVSVPGGSASESLLPDPFKRLDGTRVSAKSDWRCRRAEIRELAERSVYGDKPGKPESVTGTVSRTSITVNVGHQGRTASFSAGVDLPSGTGPFPAVIVYGGLGADTSTIKSSGAAVISYDPFSVGREGTARNNKQGAFYSVYGSQSSTGLLAAWAWGVSRIIDVVEQSGGTVLRADATGVTGCSRYGKGAFVAGAFDQRIALTMPIESGSGGVNAFRSIARESGSQPLSSAYSEQPWLGDAFGSYTGDPSALPVDTHQVVGMIAPRGLFIMDNPHIDWLGARSGAVAALGGAEVYKALGAGGNITYWSDVQSGDHCAVRSEWRTPLQQNIQKFLLKTGSSSGTFRIAGKKSANLSEWRNWQTPALSDGGGTDAGTSTGTSAGTSTGTSEGTSTGTSQGTSTGTSQGSTDGSSGGSGDGACTATYRTVNSWSGGFQGEVTVRNNGSSALNGWTVGLTLASGQSISNLWGGRHTGTSGSVTVHNGPWNGTIAANGSVTFGFVATGSSSTAPGDVTCTSP
ncbi:cellulose binding domain-containing protein [Streptomyces glaucosporus]|uniref:glucuronyl esterase domain-containing protein n=1 Tax=Streptomyces glaucosporus TaxID=284044 RepID=UPI0031D3D6A1